MTIEAYATLSILVGLFGLLIKTKLPPAAIFMGALTLVITFRLAPLEECLRGFSNSGMLTIGALFMVAAGMYTTGAIGMVSEKLIGLPKTLLGCQLKMLPPVALGSAFLNNTPIVAMMIPIIRDLSRTAKLPAKRLYIPLSFASILGGACTLIVMAAAVALMFPIALSIATDLGTSFMPFAIIIMLGASYSFISPTGYQTNLMIYGPGGYKFTDFFKIGIPLTIVVGLVSVFLTPLFFNF